MRWGRICWVDVLNRILREGFINKDVFEEEYYIVEGKKNILSRGIIRNGSFYFFFIKKVVIVGERVRF